MGIRESMNENPKIVTGITVAIIVLALILIFRSSLTGGGGEAGGTVGQVLFSNDDGKTWFPDDSRKVPPFPKDGKDAYRAYVYKCPDGKKFVSHLARYTPDAKKKLEAAHAKAAANGGAQDPILFESVMINGIEVKAPGRTTWLNQSDEKAAAIMTPRCPGGGEPESVRAGSD